MNVLIDVETLSRRLRGAGRTVLLDVRWQLGDRDGYDRYLEGHLPGAVYVDLETELAAPPSAAAGRHPLPDLAALQAAARRWGLRDGDHVVVYDHIGGMSAARAWWLLRWASVEHVWLLDGGLTAWTAAGGVLEPGEVVARAGDVSLRPGALPVLTIDEAADLPTRGVLLDARAAERYRGEVEQVDPRAGHIPGALSAPTTGNLDDTDGSSTKPRCETDSPRSALIETYRWVSIADQVSRPRTRSPHWRSPESTLHCMRVRGHSGRLIQAGRPPRHRESMAAGRPWQTCLYLEGCRSGRTGNS